ncbi:hypothetical protein SCUCBS95973_007309 [Sporothrix curviconia]|uniref:FAS1 domain-containing protein n=1 Tax=Sporothrix curviconia TaxID=1260050 RepID=A0ABP0CCQ5_9PEZI
MMLSLPSRVLSGLLVAALGGRAAVSDRLPLSYAPIPADTYVPANAAGTTTLLDLVQSRPELSLLAELVAGSAGFTQAFNTTPEWSFTFLAPSNTALANNTGAYFSTFAAQPKGKWWLGNLLQHHYVPGSALTLADLAAGDGTVQRLQTGTYLYVSVQAESDSASSQVLLNNVASVSTADLAVTSGVVHIIDHVLDPAAQIFEPAYPSVSQAFIPGSCANTALSYC